MKTLMGLVLLVGVLTLLPVHTFAGENCSAATMSSGEQTKQVQIARDTDQRASMSF